MTMRYRQSIHVAAGHDLIVTVGTAKAVYRVPADARMHGSQVEVQIAIEEHPAPETHAIGGPETRKAHHGRHREPGHTRLEGARVTRF